ncbi:MAG TPA: hybrid sensor histidine kinase/response regulator [Candidatus Rifleibacterium sp.]|jgi:DNA-binding response OmpR family regulator|nr:hybrid sensor histidine kinase/response regulator [Candidatus Rifleibacterium sp.]HOI90057.1 hybrid sensor histidine kinase/response regulator [Candidatus Rifleibacterium sp.]
MENRTKPRILVVDDIIDNIEILGSILRTEYEVIMAMNGQKALQLASGPNPPDLILLDIVMPDIDGSEVCRRLKASPQTDRIPVIFVSARDEEIDEVNGFALGAVDYIVKPVSPAIVRARVRTHLSLTSAMRQLEKQNCLLQENIRLREDIERIARHDLKGPMTVFMNAPEMLVAAGPLNQAQQNILNLQIRTTRRLMEMIHHSLDLYKMEQGTYELKPAGVDILRVLREVLRECSGLAASRDVVCDIRVDDREPQDSETFEVKGEELLFSSIFSNLVKNAIEASPDGGLVKVSLYHGHEATVKIHNSGSIPEKIRDRFFERYVTFGKDRGSGLGTYSARIMAATLGGNLSFVSNEHDGTTLIFTLRSSGEVHENSCG